MQELTVAIEHAICSRTDGIHIEVPDKNTCVCVSDFSSNSVVRITLPHKQKGLQKNGKTFVQPEGCDRLTLLVWENRDVMSSHLL